MIFLLVILVGLSLFSVGVLVGYLWGQEDGTQDAYRAVERWHEARNRSS